MKNILLAGATGYLGGFILEKLISKGHAITVLVRNKGKLKLQGPYSIIAAAVTDPATLKGCCWHVDVVISMRRISLSDKTPAFLLARILKQDPDSIAIPENIQLRTVGHQPDVFMPIAGWFCL